jgi:hypothetical protein
MIGGIIFLAIVAAIMVLFIVPFFRKNPSPPGRPHHPAERSDMDGSGHGHP